MDIEHLSKSQIILLTLLISFVTSIATGIVTVSLMDQAPPVVAQTVNRVIEHTIETVASTTPAKSQPAASVVTQEKTVYVQQTDMLSDAVAKIEPSIVHIYAASDENPTFLGIGTVIDNAGRIVVDDASIGQRSDAIVALPDGTRVRAFVTGHDADNGFAFLQGATSTGDKAITWTPARLATSQPLLGQSLVAISGKTAARIAPGVITALLPAGGGHIIDTNIAEDALIYGSPIVNTDGAIVGVSTSVARASSSQGFVPAAVLVPPAPPAKAPPVKK